MSLGTGLSSLTFRHRPQRLRGARPPAARPPGARPPAARPPGARPPAACPPANGPTWGPALGPAGGALLAQGWSPCLVSSGLTSLAEPVLQAAIRPHPSWGCTKVPDGGRQGQHLLARTQQSPQPCWRTSRPWGPSMRPSRLRRTSTKGLRPGLRKTEGAFCSQLTSRDTCASTPHSRSGQGSKGH